MAGNKKPKKRYDPMRAQRRLLAQDAKLTAKIQHMTMSVPLDGEGLQQLQAAIHLSFEDIRIGKGTLADLHNLELAAMLTTVLCASGFGLDDIQIGEDARTAVGHMVERWQAHGRVVFAGQEMGDIARAITLHDIQLEHEDMTREKMLTCLEASIALLQEQGERYQALQNT